MQNDYWIYDWAKFRQSEVVSVPKEYKIHSDFTLHADESEIRDAFTQINSLYSIIYGQIADTPEEFGMPMREKEKFRWFSKEWNESGKSPYNPFILLYQLFTCGNIDGNSVVVPINKYKDIIISYPDNSSLLHLWKMLADKAYNVGRFDDFLYCSFRLLQDDMRTADYGDMEDMADKVHAEPEKAFVYKMDETLMSLGLFRKLYGGYEGPGLAYYRSEKIMEAKGPYSFRMISRSSDMRCGFNRRNLPAEHRTALRGNHRVIYGQVNPNPFCRGIE
ncbi:MAG: hypothetical protein FWE27_04515 [Defluviitaleaceae bacterium]|nr:hypothetical protein [Defluviitaleaceae bacterium]